MTLRTRRGLPAVVLAMLGTLAACSDEGASPLEPMPNPPGICRSPSAALSGTPAAGGSAGAVVLPVSGLGEVQDRLTSELWVRGAWAYTGTYNSASRGRGNVLKVWDVSGPAPVLRNEVTVGDASTLSDVQVSDDGRLLVVATEFYPGSIVLFDLTDPARPRQISRFSTESTLTGVHTAELARVGGRLHAFLSVDPTPSRLVIADLSDPANPREVLAREMGTPFIHDVFVRDGILFTALWNGGTVMWDIGGGGRGGTVADPVRLATLETKGGRAHNVWWSGCGASTISPRYVFIGEEGPGALGSTSTGDVHVVDIGDLAAPREVAFFSVAGAGTHNFSLDERDGFLYAAYYNAGVRALNVRGDLSACTDAQREGSGGRCDLFRMGRLAGEGLMDAGRRVYVWGVQWRDGSLYASDMLNGLWKLDASALRRP
jgi:hypothetical protein